MDRAYKVVDVFTAEPLGGNPVCVVLDAEGLADAAMQRIAAWTNLSETTFLLPPGPGADYRVRIFTPRSELPFAGHPTLGTAHAALEAGRARSQGGALVQDCAAGKVALEVSGEAIAFTLPPAALEPVAAADLQALEAALGARADPVSGALLVDVGPKWVVLDLGARETVLALEPDFTALAAVELRLGATGVTVFGAAGAGADVEVRSFAPSDGINEDPVCGSGNGAVAVFRTARGGLRGPLAWEAFQGRRVGRDGRVAVRIDDAGGVRVGGRCVTVAEGRLRV